MNSAAGVVAFQNGNYTGWDIGDWSWGSSLSIEPSSGTTPKQVLALRNSTQWSGFRIAHTDSSGNPAYISNTDTVAISFDLYIPNDPVTDVQKSLTMTLGKEDATGVAVDLFSANVVASISGGMKPNSWMHVRIPVITLAEPFFLITFSNGIASSSTWDFVLDNVKVETSSGGTPTPTPTPTATPGNGGYPAVTYDANGYFNLSTSQINYIGFKPNTYNPSTPISLFVWMHGCGGYAKDDLDHLVQWNTSKNQSYMVISVGGGTGMGRDSGCWDVNVDPPRVLSAISDVQKYFNINPRKIYLGGYSSGGEMTYRVALGVVNGKNNAGLFAGLIVENSDPFRLHDSADAMADINANKTAYLSAAAWKLNIVQLSHSSDPTFPVPDAGGAVVLGTSRYDLQVLRDAGFPVTTLEKAGTHFDNDSGATGTYYDLIHTLLPYLDKGWVSPSPLLKASYYNSSNGAAISEVQGQGQFFIQAWGQTYGPDPKQSQPRVQKYLYPPLGDGRLPYVGYKPKSYNPATPTSLLVWMHGCGGLAEGDIWNGSNDYNGTGRAQNYIIISIGGRDDHCYSTGTDDPGLLADIQDVQKYFNINPKKIYLSGYSSGGDMTYHFGLRNPSMFAGLLVENSSPFKDSGSTLNSTIAAPGTNVVQLFHTSDGTYPRGTVLNDLSQIETKGYVVTRIEKAGTHYDNDNGATGTAYDLRTFLLPYIDAGWTAP